MENRLKRLLFPAVITAIAGISLLHFHLSNNWGNFVKGDIGQYYFRIRETKGLVTIRGFEKTSFKEEGVKEGYYEAGLLRRKEYVDKLPDGLVDEITIFGPFRNKPILELIRARDYNNFQPEFDKANEDFAKNRKDFVGYMQKYGIN